SQLRRSQSPQQQARAAQTALYDLPYMSIQNILKAHESYNETIREVSDETGTFLVAGEDSIPGDPEHFVDTVHFTDEGSRMMGERVARSLIESPIMDQLVRSRMVASQQR